ncbi:ER membrane protein with type-III transmembrane domains [Desmophyllum pertusum]|uniref:ER membrane protein with type-III transmembrane domains n=1 Tax=Desmophyllum pertusum TaxID=174260 RepID=A0A9W9YJT5_9CNID|nr:ER membrane protein with type-III transmembrane domains [Desmophyllum pertusum]
MKHPHYNCANGTFVAYNTAMIVELTFACSEVWRFGSIIYWVTDLGNTAKAIIAVYIVDALEITVVVATLNDVTIRDLAEDNMGIAKKSRLIKLFKCVLDPWNLQGTRRTKVSIAKVLRQVDRIVPQLILVHQWSFPFVSKVSIESQKMFLEVFEALRSGQLAKVDLQKMKAAQDIKNTVLIEQDEYQQFCASSCKDEPSSVQLHPSRHLELFQGTRHYSLHETIGLAAGAVFKTDAVLTFEQTLLQVGNVSKLCLPESTSVMLSEVSEVKRSSAVKTCSPKVVSEDPIAVSLAKKHKVDIVISSSGLNTLLDNHPPDYSKQWQLPITVKRQEDIQDKTSGHKIVFIDKPLPPQKVHAREVHEKFYKHALRRLVCQKTGEENTTTNDDTGRDCSSNVKATERLHSTGLELEKTEFEMRETDSDTRKRRATGQEEWNRRAKEIKNGRRIWCKSSERECLVLYKRRREILRL